MPKGLELLGFLAFPAVDNNVDNFGFHVYKIAFGGSEPPKDSGRTRKGDPVCGALRGRCQKDREKSLKITGDFGLSTLSTFLKSTKSGGKKQGKSWFYQRFARVIHKVIHNIDKLSTNVGKVRFLAKMRKIAL